MPSGTSVFDWTVPPDECARRRIGRNTGQGIISFLDCNLHVVHGSLPVKKRMPWDDLRPHLHVDAHRPQAIPYRTAYGRQTSGCLLTQRQFEQLESDKHQPFDVEIDSEYRFGSLTYGEVLLPGSSEPRNPLLRTHSFILLLPTITYPDWWCWRRLHPAVPTATVFLRFLVARPPSRRSPWSLQPALVERMHHEETANLDVPGRPRPLTYNALGPDLARRTESRVTGIP